MDSWALSPPSTYNEGANGVVNFADLPNVRNFLVSGTNRRFLVGRPERKIYAWWQKGGMPEMVFEYILKQNGIDPQKTYVIGQVLTLVPTAAAFSGGQGDSL